jgi:hypothetical protein
MGTPEALGCDSSEEPAEPVQAEFHDVLPPKGLHAKLILQRRGSKSTLFVGSSNLTRRGLNGPNAEIMAELEVNNPELADSLTNFFSFRQIAKLEEKEADKPEEVVRRALDKDVSNLISVEFRLDLGPSGLLLTAASKLDEFLDRNTLLVQLFSLPASRTEWLPQMQSMILHEGELPLKSQTSLVIFEAASRVDRGIKRLWTQWIPFPSLDIEKRDRAAIAAYVGPGKFRDWLRSALEGVVPTETDGWTGDSKLGRQTNSASPSQNVFALEYVLGRWARNPDEFERRIPDISSMLLAFREEIERGVEGAEQDAARKDLDEVEAFWVSVSEAISVGAS